MTLSSCGRGRFSEFGYHWSPAGWVATMQDGIGTTAYNYYPIADPLQPGAGMLEEIVGPLPQSVLGFEYDKLGRVSKRTIGGAATEWQFDALGRLEKEINPIGTFQYEYLNQTGQVTKIDYPGDVEARFGYYGNVQDRRLQSIENVRTGTPDTRFSEFGYDWNPAGWLTEWSQQRGNDPAMQYALGYDGMGRLTDAVLSEVGSSADPERRHWRYDAVGNRLVDQLDNSVRGASYNGLNQLMELSAGGPMKFRGTVDRPAIVTIDGQAAYVDPDGEFVGYAEVEPGQNQVEIRAEDELENVTVETYEVDVSGVVPRQLIYDLNGNLTDDDIKEYEWDAENRLVGIVYDDGGRTEFEYDGLSRRVRQIEKDPQGATTAEYTYLWDGLEIVERRAADGETVQRRYYAHGMEDVTGEKDYLIMRDHLGSVRDVVETGGGATVLHSDYDLWGNITSGTAAEFTGFGFTGHFYHVRSGLHLAPYRAYDAALGRWISRDPLFMAELLPEGPNLYAYVGNRPSSLLDSLGLAWESTPTQGIHYNDRRTGFGFGLTTDSAGNLKPAPLSGKSHSFDANKANQILNDAMRDPNRRRDLLNMAEQDLKNAAYKDKGRCQRILGGLRGAAVLGLLGGFFGTMQATNEARAAYEKLRDGGQLSDMEKLSLISEVANSGAPGSGRASAELLELLMP